MSKNFHQRPSKKYTMITWDTILYLYNACSEVYKVSNGFILDKLHVSKLNLHIYNKSYSSNVNLTSECGLSHLCNVVQSWFILSSAFYYFQLLPVLAANIGSLSSGLALGYSAVLLPQLRPVRHESPQGSKLLLMIFRMPLTCTSCSMVANCWIQATSTTPQLAIALIRWT